MAEGTVKVELNLVSEEYKKNLEKVNDRMRQLNMEFDKSRSSIGGAANSLKNLNVLGIASAGVIGTALVTGLWACNKAAAESESTISKLNQIIKATGGAAGVSSESAIKLAESLSSVTVYDNNAIISGEALLLTFKNIGKDIFPQATEAMLDMATVMEIDVKSAAMALGKALEDPAEGASALQKAGVKLSVSQKDQIDKFMAVNDVAKAQTVLMDVLASKMGGSARAEVNTFNGAMKQAGNAFDNLKEAIGNMTLETGTGFMKGMKNILNDITDAVKKLDKSLDKIKESFLKQKGETSAFTEGFDQPVSKGVDPWEVARQKQKKESERLANEERNKEATKQYKERSEKLEKIFTDIDQKRAVLNKDGLAQINQQELDAFKQLNDTNLKNTEKGEQAATAIAQYYADARAEYEKKKNLEIAQQAISNMQQISGGLSAILNQYMTNKNLALDNELRRGQERIQTEYDAEKNRIETTVTDEKEKARKLKALDEKKARDEEALQKKIEKEKRKAAREAAKYQKTLAITDAILNTARGVTAALGMFPPPVAWAMAAINAALGAAQISLIASQPLPELAAGGFAVGPSIIAEEGRDGELAFPLNSIQGQNALSLFADRLLNSIGNKLANSSVASTVGSSVQSAKEGAKILVHNVVQIGSKVIYDDISEATQNGELLLYARAIVG